MGSTVRLSRRKGVALAAIIMIIAIVFSAFMGGAAARADDTAPTDPAAVIPTTPDTTNTDTSTNNTSTTDTGAAATTEPATSSETAPAQPEPAAPAPAPAPAPQNAVSPTDSTGTEQQGADAAKTTTDEVVAEADVAVVWPPLSTMDIVPKGCYTPGGDGVLVTFDDFVYNRDGVEDVWFDLKTVNGVIAPEDFSATFVGGTYEFTYDVVNQYQFSEEFPPGIRYAKTGTFTVEECVIVEPPVCQDNLKGLTGSYSHTDTTSTYTMSIPEAACADLKVGFGDTYTLPADYDESGDFNESASPQPFIPSARAELVIAKGQTSVTVTKSFASVLKCGPNWVQGDTYTGPQQDVVTHPKGSNGFIAGGIFKVVVSPCYIVVPEKVPYAIDECGLDNDELIVPAPGENYKFEVVDLRVDGVGKVFVNLVATNGYQIPQGVQTQWPFEFTDKPCPIEIPVPAQPATVDECGPNNITWGSYELPEGVGALLNDDGSITFKPLKGYYFEGEAQSVTYPLPADSDVACPVTDVPKGDKPAASVVTLDRLPNTGGGILGLSLMISAFVAAGFFLVLNRWGRQVLSRSERGRRLLTRVPEWVIA